MHLNAEPFSYEKYQMAKEIMVMNIPLDDLALINSGFRRYIPLLKSVGIVDTQALAHSFFACELRGCKGLGPKFFSLVKDFTENQDGYRKLYNSFLMTKSNVKGDICNGTAKKK